MCVCLNGLTGREGAIGCLVFKFDVAQAGWGGGKMYSKLCEQLEQETRGAKSME